jgi:hypothetical protein
LYRVWITGDGNPGSRLVAVWIDSSMSVFEAEFAHCAYGDALEIGLDATSNEMKTF